MAPTLVSLVTFVGLVTCAVAVAQDRSRGEIRFPDDPRAVIDVKRDMGAKGDGTTDDTDALQRAIYEAVSGQHMRFIYLPEGTYLVTRPLILKPVPEVDEEKTGSMIGPWFYGQHRDRTIIKLADRLPAFADPAKPLEMIRGHWREDGARMNADFFDRNMVNLTLDTGDNAGATAIKYYSNNTGLMRDVRIVGNGAVGIDLGWTDQNGPHLIRGVEIDGFAVGISTRSGINSQTLSDITIRNARDVAVRHEGQVFAMEGLKVYDSPRAIDSRGGMLTLIDSRLVAGPAGKGNAAITLDGGHLYAARVVTDGFAHALDAADAPGGPVTAAKIDEYSSHPAVAIGGGETPKGLQIKPEPTPQWQWESDLAKWVCANDHGARSGDEEDDAPQIQRAIDDAADKGATTVYLLGGQRGDPNWYHVKSPVRVHGSVRHVTGFGYVRLLGGENKEAGFPNHFGGFVVDDADDGDARPVVFTHLNVFTPYENFKIDNRARRRPVVVETCTAVLFGRPGSTTFAENAVATTFVERDARMYVRQLNSEARDDQMQNINTNDGGLLWVLGLKTEMRTTKLATRGGGRTEVLGGHIYSNQAIEDDRPFAIVEGDASVMSLTAMREATFRQKPYRVVVIHRRGGQETTLRTGTFPFSLLRVGP